MKLTNRLKIIIAISTLIILSVIAYYSTNALVNGGPVLAEDENNFSAVTTLEEASRLAGYQVSTPTFIPQDFAKNPNIFVSGIYPNNTRRVIQVWYSAEKGAFFLTQDPSLDGIGGGEEAVIGGVLGERKYLKATLDKPAVLALYWHTGDMAYLLTGILKGTLDKETLNRVALSIMDNN